MTPARKIRLGPSDGRERRQRVVERLQAQAQRHAEAHLANGREAKSDRPLDLWTAKLLLEIAEMLTRTIPQSGEGSGPQKPGGE